jgi:hypothetical protein
LNASPVSNQTAPLPRINTFSALNYFAAMVA